MDNKVEAFLQLQREFAISAMKLQKAWSELNNDQFAVDAYPFNKSFDEVVVNISDWQVETHHNTDL